MPSAPGYKRDYKQEYSSQHASKKAKKQRAARNSARSLMESAGRCCKGDGKDVDHKKPLSKGGSTAKSNLRVQSASTNRSYKRKRDGSIK